MKNSSHSYSLELIMTQTITFIDSAYPEPHNLRELNWSGRLDNHGILWFDLHLISEDYYANEPDRDDEEDDDDYTSLAYWQSKPLWNNYHNCILSSTHWSDEQGFMIGDIHHPFDFSELSEKVFHIDSEPSLESEECAFSIYLAGHDACANHEIMFQQQSNGSFHILWKGEIALFYSGFTEFSHKFSANLYDVPFDGFYFPTDWSLEKATIEFKKVLRDFEYYEFVVINPKHHCPQYKLVKI